MSDLGGNQEPLPAEWANRSTQPRVGRIGGPSTGAPARGGAGRIATLGDMRNSGGAAPVPSPSRRGNNERDGDPELYAGGERSGLSIQNPTQGGGGIQNRLRDLLRNASNQGWDDEAQSGPFQGGGYRLGSDEVNSEYVPDPNAPAAGEAPVVDRVITFWRDGFQLNEDGPLMAYDNPEHAAILRQIDAGQAPEALGVAQNQRVNLNVKQRMNENYVPPPAGPFAGQGNRLGSPVPAVTSRPAAPAAPAASAAPPASSSAPASSFEVDLSQPTTSIQIRLADNTRLVCRMNLHHTVGDIRRFINAARPGNASQSYIIQTPLPVKVFTDENQTVEEAGLKNSVVVQRLT